MADLHVDIEGRQLVYLELAIPDQEFIINSWFDLISNTGYSACNDIWSYFASFLGVEEGGVRLGPTV